VVHSTIKRSDVVMIESKDVNAGDHVKVVVECLGEG
jgi:hypothetical protein